MIVLYNLFLISLAIIQNGVIAEFINSPNPLTNLGLGYGLGLLIGIPFWYISCKFRYEIMKDTQYFFAKCFLLFIFYSLIFGFAFGNL